MSSMIGGSFGSFYIPPKPIMLPSNETHLFLPRDILGAEHMHRWLSFLQDDQIKVDIFICISTKSFHSFHRHRVYVVDTTSIVMFFMLLHGLRYDLQSALPLFKTNLVAVLKSSKKFVFKQISSICNTKGQAISITTPLVTLILYLTMACLIIHYMQSIYLQK